MQKKSVHFFLFLPVFLVLLSSCNPAVGKHERKIDFSSGWYFLRMHDIDTFSMQKREMQAGKNWESQYNIETVNVTARDGTEKIDPQKELQ